MLVLHILSFGFVVGVSVIADKSALAWMRGRIRTLDPAALRAYHHLIWIGLISITVSGFILMYPMRGYLLRELLFDIKLLFVAMLFVNAVLIGRLSRIATEKPYTGLTAHEKRALIVSGAISLISWAAAFGIALLLF